MFPARDRDGPVTRLRGSGLKDRGLALTPADDTFCEALEELLRTVDYRHEAEAQPDAASGLIAWADFHRDRATMALIEGLDL